MQPAPNKPADNAESSYYQAESSYHKGKLAEAQVEAEAGYRRYLASNADWAGRFRLLQIKMMMARGATRPGLAELEKTPARAFATCELLARRDILQAFAYAQLERRSDVAASVAAAERQCPDPDPILSADLAVTRGQLTEDSTTTEEDYRTALGIARRQQDRFREASALIDLAYRMLSLEHYDEAIDLAEASLEISRKMGYRRLEEQSEGNLGFAYEKLGDLDQALSLYQQAEESARVLDAGGDRIKWRNNLGAIHEEAGQLTVAEAEYRQALTMAMQQDDKDRSTAAYGELALVSIRAGEWEQAAKFSQMALQSAHEDQNRPVELEGLLAQGLLAEHRGDLKAAEKVLAEVADDPGHDRQSTRWEAQRLLADLYAQERRFANAESEYRVALATVRAARCSVQREALRVSFQANATRVYDGYIDFLVSQGKAAEALKAADESRALTLAEGLGIEGKKCLATEAVFAPQRSAKQAGATVLFYWLGAEHSYLWAIPAAGPDRLKLYPLPPSGQIEPAVEAYRRALVGSRDVLESEDNNGAKLYRMLVAPAVEYFRSGGRVIVITDGSLSELNFETLIAPQPRPHYWIEDVTLENASSLRLLQAAVPGNKGRRNGKLLLMGNALPPSDERFGALPHAGEEIGSVRKYFSASDERIYERQDSTAGAYLASHPEQFAYIHFVAHGTASESDPLDSAVILSPSTADGSYKLYARDVITRPLKAELVTVSTCQGAGVRSYAGEGLVGLSWAFLHAGAHHVIGALWDVSDESTPQLMDAMYARLVKGSAPGAALREAKLSLLHSSAPFNKPYYWAPFQLYTGS